MFKLEMQCAETESDAETRWTAAEELRIAAQLVHDGHTAGYIRSADGSVIGHWEWS